MVAAAARFPGRAGAGAKRPDRAATGPSASTRTAAGASNSRPAAANAMPAASGQNRFCKKTSKCGMILPSDNGIITRLCDRILNVGNCVCFRCAGAQSGSDLARSCLRGAPVFFWRPGAGVCWPWGIWWDGAALAAWRPCGSALPAVPRASARLRSCSRCWRAVITRTPFAGRSGKRSNSATRTASAGWGNGSTSKLNWTALATLLTFWPPGPEAWMNRSDNSLSGMTKSPGLIRSVHA